MHGGCGDVSNMVVQQATAHFSQFSYSLSVRSGYIGCRVSYVHWHADLFNTGCLIVEF